MYPSFKLGGNCQGLVFLLHSIWIGSCTLQLNSIKPNFHQWETGEPVSGVKVAS
jgi:hypothetical protein